MQYNIQDTTYNIQDITQADTPNVLEIIELEKQFMKTHIRKIITALDDVWDEN